MTDPRESPGQPFETKGFIAGVLLVIGFSIAGCFSVFLRYEVLGTGYLPRGVIFLWLLFLAGNAVVYRISRRHALGRRAVLFALVMMLAIGGMVGQEFTQHFYLYILGIVYYTEPPTASPDLYLKEVPSSLVPSLDRYDPVVAWAYEGLPTGKRIPVRPWIGPLAIWTPFVLAYYFMLTSFAGLLARRWEQEEKLVYPLMEVPLELVEAVRTPEGPLWKSKLLWAFFAIPCVVYSIKGLHGYAPAVPDIKLQRVSGNLFAGPWAAFNYVNLGIYMDVIGVAYLLTREAAFSMWFFCVFRLFEGFLGNVAGRMEGQYRFFTYQTVGGYAVLAIALLWSAWPRLRRIFRGAFRRSAGEANAGERLCVYGFLGAFAFVIFWCVQSGLAIGWALLQVVAFLLVTMVVSRVICEAGMFVYSSPFRLNDTLLELIGPRNIGLRNVIVMTMTSWTQLRGSATQYMPAAFHNFRIGSEAGISRRQVLVLAMTAVFLALMLSHFFAPYVLYRWGIPKLANWPRTSGQNTVRGLVGHLAAWTPLAASDWVGVALGGATTIFLVLMRQRFLWWPFHPLGFVAWLGWPTERYWLSLLIGWLAKVIVVRFFGFTTFRKLRPAAFGLMLGVCFIITVWILIHFFYPAPALQLE